MLRDIFVNVSILVSCLFIAHQFYHKYIVTLDSPRQIKALYGIGHAIMGIILMEFSISVSDELSVDLRGVPVMLSALYGGLGTSLLTSLLIALARMIMLGWTVDSFLTGATLLVLGLGCGLISQLKLKIWSKWLLMQLLGVVLVTTLIYVPMGLTVPLGTYALCWIGVLLGNIIANMSTLYLRKSNMLFQQYKEDSTKDPLTGLNNVRYFFHMLRRFASSAEQSNTRLAMLLVDIDHFKDINDSYGHPAGDYVLKEIGKLLSQSCRSYDVVSRNGGEEFSILLPGCSPERALEIAERVRAGVEKREFIVESGQHVQLTVSIGASIFEGTSMSVEKLIRITDQALYRAKRNGRNQICLLRLDGERATG